MAKQLKAKWNLVCDGRTFEAGKLYPAPLDKAVDPSNFDEVDGEGEAAAATEKEKETEPEAAPKKRK